VTESGGLFAELKRRNVFRVGIAYVVGAWLLLQFTEVITELLSLPPTIGPVVVAVVAIGLPVALFLAWAYELTPDGVKRETEVDRAQSTTSNTGKKLNGLIMGLLVVAVVVLLADKFLVRSPQDDPSPADGMVQSEAQPTPAAPDQAATRPSIAVLPFDNRSNREEDQFFTDGIHDDLLTTLAKIGALKVISRTSVMEYRDTTKKIPQIADELGVNHVLEGGIQRAGDVVRVNVQLIDADTDEHLWAEIYDRELTASNLFAIQNEISLAVAEALHATLTPKETEQLDRRPTDSLAAYDAYLRGRQLMAERTSTGLTNARAEFLLATELDPGFSLAWVGIAETNLLLTVYGSQSPDVSLQRGEAAVRQALDLDPSLGEAWTALGAVLEWKERFDEAETAYQRGVALAPNHATAWHWYFDFLMDRPERLDEAVVASEKARELDPRSSIIRNDAAFVYLARGDVEAARIQYEALIEIDPDFVPAYNSLAELHGADYGDLPEGYRWGLKAVERDPGSSVSWGNLAFPLLIAGAWDTAEAVLEQAAETVETPGAFDWIFAYSSLAQGKPDAAREYLGHIEVDEDLPGRNWGLGIFHVFSGDLETAREVMFVGASDFGDRGNWERLLARYKNDACLAGWVLMASGEKALGEQLLVRSIEYLETELPNYIERPERYGTAACHAALGDEDRALDALEASLEARQYHDWRWKVLWPPMAPLRDRPRFNELEGRFEREMERQRAEVLRVHEERFEELGT
jgi:TolB-like protein/Tfp pilus assembly protein PilF